MISGGSRTRWVLAGVAGLVVVAGAGTSIQSQLRFGTVSWWGTPSRLHWCGRDYDSTTAGPRVRRNEIPLGHLDGSAPYPLHTIGRLVPGIGPRLVASVTPVAEQRRFSPPLPCTTAVYLQRGADSYVAYDLVGGP